MGKHDKAIVDKLLQSYEKSIQANPFQESQNNRRICYLMKKYKEYDVQDLDSVNEINGQLEELEQQHYIQIEYHKEHANHIVRVSLVLHYINEIYQEYRGHSERSQEAMKLEQLIMDTYERITKPWIQQFLEEEMIYLKTHGWMHSYIGKDIHHICHVFQVLIYVDQGHCSYFRTMSVQLFQDTKYFENELKNCFLSIVKRYEETCLASKDVELVDSEIFRLLGFSLYPEIFEWCGHMILYKNDHQFIDTSLFSAGYSMNADMLFDIVSIILPHVKRMILIENKASYYHMLQERQKDDLIIYAGGHFSPMRKMFYELLSANYRGKMYLWSDIDLGGFLMYARLKRDVFHTLEPYAMDVDTYLRYLPYAKHADEDYLQRLRKAQENQVLECFYDVIECILIHKKTLEQEAMMILDAKYDEQTSYSSFSEK